MTLRLIIVFITLLLAKQPESQKTEIYGHWKLIKIETQNEVFRPELKDYFLQITSKKISYNLEVNQCQSVKLYITENQIDIQGLHCNKICCDGRIDSISNFIHYN